MEGNWKELRGDIKKRWGKLTDDDLTAIAGHRSKARFKSVMDTPRIESVAKSTTGADR